jgi:hypothetical protein
LKLEYVNKINNVYKYFEILEKKYLSLSTKNRNLFLYTYGKIELLSASYNFEYNIYNKHTQKIYCKYIDKLYQNYYLLGKYINYKPKRFYLEIKKNSFRGDTIEMAYMICPLYRNEIAEVIKNFSPELTKKFNLQ